MAEEKKDKAAAETETAKGEEPKKNETEPEVKKAGQSESAQEEKAVDQEKVEAEAPQVNEELSTQKKISIQDLTLLPGVRDDLPEIKPGDVLRVSYRVIEGGKERIQVFEGTVIAIKNSGIARTITVRKTSFGIAVERIFPLNSRLVQKIEVKKHSKVRRAKLYYLRKLKGKAARLKELR